MSGGERKKRLLPHGAKGWEEAGGEFYQESYPGADSADSDLEVLQTDPHRISTLLPSAKTRTATMKRDVKLATLRHRSTLKSHYQTAIAPNNDIQISLLPDLSENLSNEELLWEEIMKIKAMPVNMAQKRGLKAQLMRRDTLRLQGFKQFKWKRKQSFLQLRVRLEEIGEKFILWRGSLKKIEGHYGTGVVSFFLFVKWLICLNIILSVIMGAFVIIPTMLWKHLNFTEYRSTNDSAYANASQLVTALDATHKLVDIMFDPESMVTSPLYYAYYDRNYHLNLILFKIDLPLAYFLATVICLSFSFLSVLKNAANCFKHRLLENQGMFYAYCNLVFSGWDFCVRNERSAKIKHKAIYNEIVGRLAVEKRKEERRNRTKHEFCKLCCVRIFVNIAVFALLMLAGFVIFVTFRSSNERNLQTNAWFVKILLEFSAAGCIIFFNVVLPFVFNWLGKFERFSPIFTTQLAIFRTIVLRFSSLCVLLGSIYEKLLESRTQPDEDMNCWESYLARELYKLLILNLITQIFYTFFLNFPRSFLAKHCRNRLVQYFGKQKFDLSTHVLDAVYVQTIVWLGCFYAPVLPCLGVFVLLVVFYTKRFACLVNCQPASDMYYASRSHSLYMFVLLTSLVFSVVPWVYAVLKIRPSKMYGPFVQYDTVWSVVRQIFDEFPEWMTRTTTFCVSSTFLVPFFCVLILTTYYYYAVYRVNKQMVLVLKRQLILEGHDKQFLLNRLSAFVKQQQERFRPNDAADKRRQYTD